MIVFGSLEPAGTFEACVQTHGEADSLSYVSDAHDLVDGYREIAVAARGLAGLEALVLARPRATFGSLGLCARIRAALAIEGVGLVAAAGARHVQDLRWWTAEVVEAGEVHCPAPPVIAVAPAHLDLVERAAFVPPEAFEAEIAWHVRARGHSVIVADLGHVAQAATVDEAFLAADAWWRVRWSGVGQ